MLRAKINPYENSAVQNEKILANLTTTLVEITEWELIWVELIVWELIRAVINRVRMCAEGKC